MAIRQIVSVSINLVGDGASTIYTVGLGLLFNGA